MIRPPQKKRKEVYVDRGEAYVPSIPLSDFAVRQYNAIKNADTGLQA